MTSEVPWKIIPLSEPVLPGERSTELLIERGVPVYVPVLVATIAELTTTEAQRLVEQGQVRVDGATARASWTYVKPGTVVEVGPDRSFRIGYPE